VDLLRCIGLSNWTGENIQSYEPENSLMKVAIFCDEHTLHETHVGLKRQRAGESRASSGASDAVLSNKTLKISDLRGFIEGLQRRGGRLSRKMVDEDAER
jgi:hypothetical protein